MLFENEDDEIKNIEENLEADFIVNPIDKEKYVLPYSLYFRLLSYDTHFSEASLKYKRLAISWLIASFIGIGFLATKNVNVPFLKLASVSILSLIAIKGISILWFMDINIYQKFLNSTAKEALSIEEKFNFLPSLCKDEKILATGQRGHIFYTSLFYGCCIWGIFVIYGVGVFNNSAIHLGKLYAAIISVSFVLLAAVIIFKIVNLITKKIKS